ncbi:MAG: DUF1990 family protein [Rhodothermales bacterium]|nr:DUF1990 family protein [Rhodothermales bacterium]
MAEWRIGRGWTEAELEARLGQLASAERNFSAPFDEMDLAHGWNEYYSEAVVGQERPGPPEPEGPFERGAGLVASYAFSDPRIVIGHFDPDGPLLGRRMLLEMRALRVLHYLGGVVVGATRSETEGGQTVSGFRYDTLEGHIEQGAEWFLLKKDHATGALRFRIQAAWRPGDFPNWWSRLGFSVLGPRYQKLWHHRAHALLSGLMQAPDARPLEPGEGRLVHTKPDVVFERYRAPHA